MTTVTFSFTKANLTEPKKKKPRSGDVPGKNNTDLKVEERQPPSEKKESTMPEVSGGNKAPLGKGRSETQQLGNDPPRRSQLKLAAEPPKIKIDQKKIMANLREKKAMCNDVALIGTGGKAQLNKLGKSTLGKASASNTAFNKTGDKEFNKKSNSKTWLMSVCTR